MSGASTPHSALRTPDSRLASMIITRTPFRVSFFGGGTDYPVWYQAQRGAVLATTINKYCYISARWLPPFFDHISRIFIAHNV